ncbi:MAG: hypothetical protein AAFV93_15435 [Chloroflexota bacterium]
MEINLSRTNEQIDVEVNGIYSHCFNLADVQMTQSRWTETIGSAETFGQSLYRTLFQEQSKALQQLQVANTPQNTERICLDINNDPVLEVIPWEYLHDGTRFIAIRHHLLRCLPPVERRDLTLNTDMSLNVLAMLANPAKTANRRIAVRQA